MITLSDISRSYGSHVALSRVSLEFAAGTTSVLLGPSGCGKSTLLRTIIGLVRPDSGSVRIGGIELTASTAGDIRRRTGFVVQQGGLFPHLTARQNATIQACELGWERAEVSTRLEELCDLVHLSTERLDRYPGELSGGQNQRLGLIRALMLDPEILLLDEPLGALDPMIRADLQHDLIEIFASLSKTVVMVTHDLVEAGLFANEIILMNEGTVVQRGSMDDLTHRPDSGFVTRFIRAHRHKRPGEEE